MKKAILFVFFASIIYNSFSFAQDNTVLGGIYERKQVKQFYFELGSANLSREAISSLDSLISKKELLSEIELQGHCDSVGDNALNDVLSQRRVLSVKNYLLSRGVKNSQIVKTENLGKRNPLNQNLTESDRQNNRRVEMRFLISDPKSSEPKKTATTQNAVTPPKNNVTPPKVEDKKLKEKIQEIKEGGTLVLKNMNFEGGHHILLEESLPALDELHTIMVEIPTLEIEIQGHICCQPDGKDGFDQLTQTNDLSVQRAKTIYDSLVSRGIAAKRLSYVGFGGKFPLVNELTEADQKTNRRVEIKIKKK